MLLTKTTEIAIQCLVLLSRLPKGSLITPQPISLQLGSSESYTSKILRTLAKADLLASHRGASGGFSLARDPKDITLLDVVEACEGAIIGNHCREFPDPAMISRTCGFHQAMVQFQEGVKQLLSQWSIEDVAKKPLSSAAEAPDCKLRRILGAEDNFPKRGTDLGGLPPIRVMR
jgi:Rrf2 family transcriptional regulator, iron-sulfur cluster assembly transcription factor